MFKLTMTGSFDNTDKFIKSVLRGDQYEMLNQLGWRGVDALRAATPVDSGDTAASWGYEIVEEHDRLTIWWTNSNQVDGFNIAVGLQYGHATGTGGYVEGYDYINPSIRPVFDEIIDAVWKEVQDA